MRPYIKIVSDGKSAIHFAFTNGHPRDEPENSIHYFKYQRRGFFRADGTRIGSIDQLPLSHAESEIVYNGKATGIRAWIWDIAIDARGTSCHRLHALADAEPITATVVCAGTATPGWTGKSRREDAGFRKRQSGGVNASLITQAAWRSSMPTHPSFMSRRPSGGVFEIEKYTTADNGMILDGFRDNAGFHLRECASGGAQGV